MSPITRVITSTADLTPNGVAGYLKAIIAGVSAGLLALATALTDGQVTASEWVTIALAVLATGGGTWFIPNTVKPVAVVPYPSPASTGGTVITPYEDDLGGPIA